MQLYACDAASKWHWHTRWKGEAQWQAILHAARAAPMRRLHVALAACPARPRLLLTPVALPQLCKLLLQLVLEIISLRPLRDEHLQTRKTEAGATALGRDPPVRGTARQRTLLAAAEWLAGSISGGGGRRVGTGSTCAAGRPWQTAGRRAGAQVQHSSAPHPLSSSAASTGCKPI